MKISHPVDANRVDEDLEIVNFMTNPSMFINQCINPFSFPPYFEALHELLAALSAVEMPQLSMSLNSSVVALAKLNNPLQDCNVIKAAQLLPSLVDQLDSEGIELLLVFILPLFTNPETRLLAFLNMFHPLGNVMGFQRSLNAFYNDLQKLYDRPNEFTPEESQLLDHQFISKVITVFGLSCFLEQFMPYVIEGLVENSEGQTAKERDDTGSFHHQNSAEKLAEGQEKASPEKGQGSGTNFGTGSRASTSEQRNSDNFEDFLGDDDSDSIDMFNAQLLEGRKLARSGVFTRLESILEDNQIKGIDTIHEVVRKEAGQDHEVIDITGSVINIRQQAGQDHEVIDTTGNVINIRQEAGQDYDHLNRSRESQEAVRSTYFIGIKPIKHEQWEQVGDKSLQGTLSQKFTGESNNQEGFEPLNECRDDVFVENDKLGAAHETNYLEPPESTSESINGSSSSDIPNGNNMMPDDDAVSDAMYDPLRTYAEKISVTDFTDVYRRQEGSIEEDAAMVETDQSAYSIDSIYTEDEPQSYLVRRTAVRKKTEGDQSPFMILPSDEDSSPRAITEEEISNIGIDKIPDSDALDEIVKMPYSRFAKSFELDACPQELSLSSLRWIIPWLGPVLTTRYVVNSILKKTPKIWLGVRNLELTDDILTETLAAKRKYLLDCLVDVVHVYGNAFVLHQFMPYAIRAVSTVMFIVYCLLSIAYCLLPIAYCLLPVAYCRLPVTYYLLPIAYYLLPIAYYLLPIVCCLLLVAYCLLPITYCLLPIAYCLIQIYCVLFFATTSKGTIMEIRSTRPFNAISATLIRECFNLYLLMLSTWQRWVILLDKYCLFSGGGSQQCQKCISIRRRATSHCK